MPPTEKKKTTISHFNPFYGDVIKKTPPENAFEKIPGINYFTGEVIEKPALENAPEKRPSFNPVKFTNNPPVINKPYDCETYKAASNLEKIPFFYQAAELKTYSIKPSKQMEIRKRIDEQFTENSKNAKIQFIEYMVTKYKETTITEDSLRAFYNHIRVYTKKEFLQMLIKGFKWTLNRLNEAKIQSQEKEPLKWILMTERYISMIDAGNLSFKSSEWIGRMFINYKKDYSDCSCILESTFPRNDTIDNIIKESSNDIYILFDDGAYSGSQKGFIIDNFLSRMSSLRKHSQLYLVIPYYTLYALNKFKYHIDIFLEKKPEQNRIETYTIDSKSGHHYYKIIIADSVVEIYIWIGGEQMQLCEDIFSKMENKGINFKKILGSGATLSLFEHKVPDSLSLDAYCGIYFNHRHEALKQHYEFNPPYKVKPVTNWSKVATNGGSKKRLKANARGNTKSNR